MQASVKTAIKSIIAKARIQLDSHHQPAEVKKYSGVIQEELRSEFLREIERVEAMLEDEVTFESRLKERCSKRSHDYEKSLPLRYLPDSPANKFYWELVAAVFKPENTQKMFEILLPDLKYQLDIRLTQKGAGVEIVKAPLQADLKVDYTDLPHYIITRDTILDNRILKKLDVKQQKYIQQNISSLYPEMRQGMYELGVLREMLTGMVMKPEKPASPRRALQRLLMAYQKGSSSVTRDAYAPESTWLAISEFSDFLETLTVERRELLRQLRNYNSRTLGSIIDDEIYNGKCAEATSKLISGILDANQAPDTILDVSVSDHKNDKEAVVELQSCELPGVLLKRLPVIGKLPAHEVAYILADMPAAFYSSYIRHYRHLYFTPILTYINSGTMNNEQLHAFVDAIAQHCPTQRKTGEFIAWLKNMNSLSLFKVYINRCSESEIPDLIKRFDQAEEFRLLLERSSPEGRLNLLIDPQYEHKWPVMARYLNKDLLQGNNVNDLKFRKSKLISLFNNFAGTHRKRIIKFAREMAQSGIIPANLTHPDCDWLMEIEDIDVLLALLSNNDMSVINQFFLTPDRNGQTVFHQHKSASVIAYFLNLFSPTDRQSKLTAPDNSGVRPLDRRSLPDEAMTEMVKAIPTENRFKLFTAEMHRGGSLIYQAADNTDRLRILLESLSPAVRLKAVLLPYQIESNPRKVIENVIYRAASADNPAVLKALLNTLAPEERLLALLGNGAAYPYQSALRSLDARIGHVVAAISCLKDSEVDDLLMMIMQHRQTLLDTVIYQGYNRLQDVEMLVSRLTPHRLQQLFSVRNNSLVSHFVDHHIGLLPSILKRLPDKQRMDLVELNLSSFVNQRNDAITADIINTLPRAEQTETIQQALHHSSNRPELFKKLLQLLDPEKCMAVLQQPCGLLCRSSMISETYPYTDRLTNLLESIPAKYRLSVLLAKLPDGGTVIQARLNNSMVDLDNEIARWAAQLDDDQACEFLQQKRGSQTLTQLYINSCMNSINRMQSYNRPYHMVSLLAEKYRQHQTPRSFMQDMLMVMVYLQYDDQRVRESQFCWGLFQTTAAGDLLAKLMQCKTVDEFKLTLMTEIDNPKSTYSLKAASALTNPQSNDSSNVVALLKKQWKMDKVMKRLEASDRVVNY